MTPDDQPYCGVELLPHATMPDGSAAPIVCDLPLHEPGTKHHSEEPDWSWSWDWNDKVKAAGY